MTFDFECVRCDYNFELDYIFLSDDPSGLLCPNCGSTADINQVEDLLAAIDDLTSAMLALRRKFSFAVQLETEDIESDDVEDEDEDEEFDDDIEDEVGDDWEGGF